MAITDIKEYAHLTQQDVEALGFELDALRRDVAESLGAKDATYIRRTIAFQRVLDGLARLMIHAVGRPRAWSSGRRRWVWPRASRTWRSATTSRTGSGTG